jgi:glycosyltransferase involved in cell wall biosynthesis
MDIKNKKKVLFICRQSDNYKDAAYCAFRKYSGLFTSARLMVDMLNTSDNIEAKIVIVNDNNDIDREVHGYKPSVVIIEALWVVPEKFEILQKLHPKVTWIIRTHSDVAFLATEGMSLDWINRYLDYKNLVLAPNSIKGYNDIMFIIKHKYGHLPNYHEYEDRVVYLPNFYNVDSINELDLPFREDATNSSQIDIGCFGAIRPLKNQLNQAIAACKFADQIGKNLNFHINGTRLEGEKGTANAVLKNIRQLFLHSPKHRLIEHDWMPHSEFLRLLASIDLGMQVSFTETFNIVTADMISVGVPMVVSKEIYWMPYYTKAETTDVNNIVRHMHLVYKTRNFPGMMEINKRYLRSFTKTTKHIWFKYISYI